MYGLHTDYIRTTHVHIYTWIHVQSSRFKVSLAAVGWAAEKECVEKSSRQPPPPSPPLPPPTDTDADADVDADADADAEVNVDANANANANANASWAAGLTLQGTDHSPISLTWCDKSMRYYM